MKWLLVLMSCWWSIETLALEDMVLKLGITTGHDWRAEGVMVQLHGLNDEHLSLTLDIASLKLAPLKKPLQNLKLTCPHTQYNHIQIVCPQADLYLERDLMGDSPWQLSFTYQLLSQQINLRLEAKALAGGQVILQANTTPDEWQADVDIQAVNLEKLSNQFKTFIDLPSWILSGYLYLKVKLLSKAQQLTTTYAGQIQDLNFSNAEGNQAGEKLAVQLTITTHSPSTNTQAASSHEEQLQVQGQIIINSGNVYFAPWYVEVKNDPVILVTDFTWQSARLIIHHFSYTHTQVLSLRGYGELTPAEHWAIKTLSLRLSPTAFSPLYERYLQAWLGNDSQLGQLKVNGTITAQFNQQQETRQWRIELQHVNLEHQQQRFGLMDLNGTVQWHSSATHLASDLTWRSGYLASNLKLGASQLSLQLVGGHIELLQPWHQPLMDSMIHIERFQLDNLGEAQLHWQLQGQLEPIAMQTFSMALGGPAFEGQLQINEIAANYHNQQLQIDAPLRLAAFDGMITISRFKMDKPFSSQPTLQADLEISKLNLQTLTKITGFGEIQGQLSGYVKELQLVNWQPITFNAYFATPSDSNLPHQISQKAINNLSNLGGGAAVNAISKSILRIFENFSYQRLGWGCHLIKGVCQMRGVEALTNGYYLVKGGGLPRIDVIGYNNQVDWQVLVTRLQRIFHTQTPVTH
ncbi:MAG: hypothetical protein HC877_06535 [Thioploca sp.]|nr:hypothetical protein [Thioploca sp.]